MINDLGVRNSSEAASKIRLTVLMLISVLFATVILLRAAYIQLLTNPRLEAMARRQFQSRSLIRPVRGMILDRYGEPLAINVEKKSLAANPGKIQNKRSLARMLARSTDLPFHKVLQKLNENREFVWIKRHLSEAELRRIKKNHIIDSARDLIEGLWMVKESDRVYPHRRLAAHLLGDVNIDSEGLEGVELWRNEQLRGKIVSISAIKDALGRPTFIDTVAAKNVQDGEPVTLTIDASLQYEVEQELNNAVRNTGSKGGTVIVMNSENGEILAMANEPSFDANEKGNSPDRRRNRAITDGYEPGSTLKAVLLSSALSQGWKLSDMIWGEKGSLIIQGKKISEAEAHEKFGWLSLKKMIQLSSNVAAAKVALKLGVDRYLKTLKSFGLGTRTGLGFPGEISGKIPLRKNWQPLTLANIGFGQGILVTPIQMIRAYAAFQNGGWLVQPSLIKKADPPASKATAIRILSPKISAEVTEALQSVTEAGGTGAKASLLGYDVAGKTGTSQMVDPATGRYSREKYIASFIGYPVNVEPKIVIYTSLVEPRGSYYASMTAAPLFKEVLNSVANRCGLPSKRLPSPIRVLAEQNFQDKIQLSQASPMMKGDTGFIMPLLKGLTPREVIRVIQGHHFQLEISGIGVVSNQWPNPGKSIAEGDIIRLILSEP